MKTQFEKILLAIVVIGILTLAIFHSCKNIKEEEVVTKNETYSLDFNNMGLIEECESFYIIEYTTGDTTINIYASVEDMVFIDSLLYSIENVESDSLIQEMIDGFGDEIGYKWSDYLKQYVIDIR